VPGGGRDQRTSLQRFKRLLGQNGYRLFAVASNMRGRATQSRIYQLAKLDWLPEAAIDLNVFLFPSVSFSRSDYLI
jgi:hypothetical protein